MNKPETRAVSFRLPPDKLEVLERLAKATDRPRSWHIEQALNAYLELQAWQIAYIEEGLGDAEAGRLIPHERVRDWLATWGDDQEGEPPA